MSIGDAIFGVGMILASAIAIGFLTGSIQIDFTATKRSKRKEPKE